MMLSLFWILLLLCCTRGIVVIQASNIKEQLCDAPIEELKRELDMFMSKKQYENAVEVSSLLIEKSSDGKIQENGSSEDTENHSGKYIYKRAQIYDKLRKFHLAISDLNILIDLYEESDKELRISALNLRARVHYALGWCAESFQDYSAVLGLKPSHGDAKKKMPIAQKCVQQLNNVMRMKRQGMFKEAEKALDELVETTGSQTVYFVFMRAESRFEQKKYYEAIADLGTVLKIDPADTNSLMLRAKAYYNLGEYSAAKLHIKEIMKFDLDHEEAKSLNKIISSFSKHMKNGKDFIGQNDIENAVNEFLQAVNLDPNHRLQKAQVFSEICNAYISAKEIKKANQFCISTVNDFSSEELPDKVDLCVSFAEFHLNHCDSEEMYDENLRIWNKCREAAGNAMNQKVQQGIQKAEASKKRFLQKDRDYYGILQIPKDADGSEIRKQYRKMAKEMHPDRFVGAPEEEVKAAEQKFHRLAQAYEVLSNDELREKYDRGEDVENPNAGAQQQQGFHNFHGFPFNFQQGGGNHFGGGGRTFRFNF